MNTHTLIEDKGVTDDLEPADVFVLLGYARQYMAMHEVSELEEMCLMVVADRIPASFVARVEQMRGMFAYVGDGLWRGQLAGLPLRGVELREAYKTSLSERWLYLFYEGIYDLLCQHVQQLRRDPATMHMKDIEFADEGLVKARRQLIANAPWRTVSQDSRRSSASQG